MARPFIEEAHTIGVLKIQKSRKPEGSRFIFDCFKADKLPLTDAKYGSSIRECNPFV